VTIHVSRNAKAAYEAASRPATEATGGICRTLAPLPPSVKEVKDYFTQDRRGGYACMRRRQGARGSCHHTLEKYLGEYVAKAEIALTLKSAIPHERQDRH
jgi:hypothetical protein